MAASAAAGVGLGSAEDGSFEDSWASRKSSAGSKLQSVFVSSSDKLSTYGIVVLLVRRSGSVVNGLSAPRAAPPDPREFRKFWTMAEVSWGPDEGALRESEILAYLLDCRLQRKLMICRSSLRYSLLERHLFKKLNPG